MIEAAIKDFQESKRIIEDVFESKLYVIQRAATESLALSEQAKRKLILYTVQKNTIQQAIGTSEDEPGIIAYAYNHNMNINIENVDIGHELPAEEDVNNFLDEIAEFKTSGFRGCFKLHLLEKIKPKPVQTAVAETNAEQQLEQASAPSSEGQNWWTVL